MKRSDRGQSPEEVSHQDTTHAGILSKTVLRTLKNLGLIASVFSKSSGFRRSLNHASSSTTTKLERVQRITPHIESFEKTEPKGEVFQNSLFLKIIFTTIFIDAIMALVFFFYYYSITPVFKSAMTALEETAGLSILERIISLIGMGAAFVVVPCAIYTLFCAFKLPALANERILPLRNLHRLFHTNLRLAILALLVYSLFEWLGAALKEEFVVYLAGAYLAVSLIFLYILSCMSHAKTWHWSASPIRASLNDAASWKTAIPHIIGIAGEIALVTWAFAVMSTPQTHPAWTTFATGLAVIVASGISNMYQLKLNKLRLNETYKYQHLEGLH